MENKKNNNIKLLILIAIPVLVALIFVSCELSNRNDNLYVKEPEEINKETIEVPEETIEMPEEGTEIPEEVVEMPEVIENQPKEIEEEPVIDINVEPIPIVEIEYYEIDDLL